MFWFPGSPGARHQVPVEAAAEARARDLRITTVERPGTGHSTVHHDDRVIDFVDDFRAVANQLGVERFALVGLSGGGPFLLAVAHEIPERTVVGVVLGGIGPTRGSDSIVSYTLLLVPAAPVLSHFAGYTEPAEVLDVICEAWPRAAATPSAKRSRRSG